MTAPRVLIDSGPLLALFNGSDRWHPIVVAWLRANPQTKLFTTCRPCAGFCHWTEVFSPCD